MHRLRLQNARHARREQRDRERQDRLDREAREEAERLRLEAVRRESLQQALLCVKP